jgi:hypothetical protein
VYTAYREADLRVPQGAPLCFRYGHFQPETDIELHSHPWGQINRINLGLMEVVVETRRLTAPAEYLTWVLANQPHSASIQQATDFLSVHVAEPFWGIGKGCSERDPLCRARQDVFDPLGSRSLTGSSVCASMPTGSCSWPKAR